MFGQVLVHRADRIDTSIVVGRVDVARGRRGCVRYNAVPPGSRTPRRHRCQRDLAEANMRESFAASLPEAERRGRLAALRQEGAEDGSEMGSTTTSTRPNAAPTWTPACVSTRRPGSMPGS